ncbi:MAG: GTPase Era [Clostridiales bacterium]|nr:GTPase Era [Clostridiales bacterium]
MKSGFVCLAGLPNAGKSTLINSMVGEKVAIVSWRPQTTRDNILGILTTEEYQMVFIDTPGIHVARNNLGKYMMTAVNTSIKNADVIVYVIDAAKGVTEEDEKFLSDFSQKMNVIAALNKSDSVVRETIFKGLEKLNEIKNIKSVVPISAKQGDNLDTLKEEILKFLPEGEMLYTDDMFTDKPLKFMAAEYIREKAFYLLDKEVPYGIGVEVRKFERREGKPIWDIYADIIVEKPSHKAIVIGKKGEMIKRIASGARQDIEELLGEKVFLEVYVKVKEDWRDSDYLMKELGYDIKNLK